MNLEKIKILEKKNPVSKTSLDSQTLLRRQKNFDDIYKRILFKG